MDIMIGVYLTILVLGFFLFAREVFPLEISALLVLVLLVLTGILTAEDAFSSFGNQSIILIGSLFVLIAGLKKTGIIKRVEENLIRISGSNRTLSFVILLCLVAFVSAFVSNTATLAVSIPIIVSIARKFGDSPKRWLMPIAFASVLGGMNSLIGTSTNIIISSLLPDYNIPGFNLFTTAYVGFPILVVGIIYLVIASKYLIPKDETNFEQSIDVKYDIRSYTAEVLVSEESLLCNVSLENTPLFKEVDITVLSIARKGHPLLYPRAGFIIRSDDRLVVEGNINKLTEITDKYGLKFVEELKTEGTNGSAGDKEKEPKELEFHEVLVTPQSLLNNSTPAEVFLRNRYRISLIAINRHGRTLHNELSEVRISAGDILVVQFLGHIDNNLLDYLGLVPLQKLKQERFKSRRASLAAAIFILALITGSVTTLPIALTCLCGVILLVVTKILRVEDVYDAVDWKVLIFIGAILCLGKGMAESGSADFLAFHLSEFLGTVNPHLALTFFFIITVVMTTLLSNQATAVVMVPLAISTAEALGLEAMPFIMSVTIAASCCFVTPFEPAFMLVYGPGGYKFSDFFRLGIILNILAVLVAVYMIPFWWGF